MDFKTFKKNVNKYRSKAKIVLTKEQREFIMLCREGDAPVSYRKMADLWQELGWGEMSKSGMEERSKKVKAGKL